MNQVLVISDVPVFKVNAGNRKCIKEYCDVLRELGANVTMLLISNHNTDKNDIKETEIYFGKENFILYKSNFIEEVIHSVIVHFRKYVSKNHYRIDDLCHANILHFISKTTKKRHFDSVIVNYLYYSKILNYCNVKTKALFVHDDYIFNNIRSNRNYFTLTPNDEAKGLQRAPFIFAIQENEACLYNYLAPKSSILCVYSPFKFTKQEISNNKNILFFSGRNDWNVKGVTFFIDKVVPLIKNQFTLLIGGKICEILNEKKLPSNIILCGTYDSPDTFYQQGDIVINPVFYGSGLKIKTFEALSYGKITVVHKHSSIGIYKKESSPLFIVDNETEFAYVLDDILSFGIDRKTYQKKAELYMEDYNSHIKQQYKNILL